MVYIKFAPPGGKVSGKQDWVALRRLGVDHLQMVCLFPILEDGQVSKVFLIHDLFVGASSVTRLRGGERFYFGLTVGDTAASINKR